MGIKKLLITSVMAGALFGCVEGHCRRRAENPAMPPVAQAENQGVDQAQTSPDSRVFVYKYDGSLQCGMGKVISLKRMQKQLKGIHVYSAAKKTDGLMHIQVCGSITGKANVYEISSDDLKKAESYGFKKWSLE